ncbi:MAG TPA: hypothetical protein VGA72_05450 [Anaerolineales bacterium]
MKSLRFFLPRIEYMLFAAMFLGIAANGHRILNFDGDLPRHILMGELILQTHHVSTTDIFSFRTVGYPSIPHEWLTQVLFAGVYDWLGLGGIVLITALIIMLTWSIVYYEALRKSNSLFAAMTFTVLAVGAAQIHVLPRPHILSYILTAIWIALLERIGEGKQRAGWPLPLVMLLWVNLHGMFVIGIFIWGVYLAGDFLDHPSRTWFSSAKARTLMIGGALSLVTTLFSPSGPHIWTAITSLGSNTYITSKIPEYQSANFHLPETWPFIIILLLVFVAFARTTEKVSWIEILLVVSFAGFALYTSRMIPMFAIVATPIAAKAFAGWMQNDYNQSRLFIIEKNIHKINSSSNGLIWLPVVIIGAIMFFNSGKALDSKDQAGIFDERFFPVKATMWLQHHPQRGHMFNEFDWGGYLLLELWPSYQIFMDGHTHIYGEELTREYERVITLDSGWEEILVKYDVAWVIVRADAALERALSASGNWEIAYRDQTAIILIRR